MDNFIHKPQFTQARVCFIVQCECVHILQVQNRLSLLKNCALYNKNYTSEIQNVNTMLNFNFLLWYWINRKNNSQCHPQSCSDWIINKWNIKVTNLNSQRNLQIHSTISSILRTNGDAADHSTGNINENRIFVEKSKKVFQTFFPVKFNIVAEKWYSSFQYKLVLKLYICVGLQKIQRASNELGSSIISAFKILIICRPGIHTEWFSYLQCHTLVW